MKDQMLREVRLPVWPPRRIVSLVPSQTEFLATLGLGDAVLGITKFCVHPADWFASKKRVGGTKTLDFQKIASLQPDLIIGNKEENEQAQIEWLAERYPVWMSDICNLEQALDMMRQLGKITGKSDVAQAVAGRVETDFAGLPAIAGASPRVAYLIWRKPYMVAGSGTFIDDMLRRAGFENVFAALARYPEISLAQLAEARPDVLLLSSEPYPFAEKHFPALREVCPEAQIQLVDGEMFSWYGSRLLHAPAHFADVRQKIGLV